MKTAIITGIFGQDGYYLAKLLLEKGYRVVGIQRRTSTSTGWRLLELPNYNEVIDSNQLIIEAGDITDHASIARVVAAYKPDEFYNLAAQSQVWQSFKAVLSTLEITGIGAAVCLEAVKEYAPDCKFYQAGSSEQFGNSAIFGKDKPEDGIIYERVLNEESPMIPRSPYGVAKLAAHALVRNYREAHGMFAVGGILFNHECCQNDSPLLIRTNKIKIDVVRIKDLVKHDLNTPTWLPSRLIEIWDGDQWTRLNAITTRAVQSNDNDKQIRVTNTRHGIVKPTNHHNMLNEFGEKRRNDTLEVGDKLLHGKYPTSNHLDNKVMVEEAELIGIIAGDGWISKDDAKIHIAALSNDVIDCIMDLWSAISRNTGHIGKVYQSEYGKTRRISLADQKWATSLNLRSQLYNSDKEKKVPSFILNGSREVQYAFLKGYNMADGLKANKCTYEFKNFKTKSAHLAQGLLYLVAQVTGQNWNITYEIKDDGRTFYSINLLSPNSKIDPRKGEIVLSLLDKNIPLRQIAQETGYSRKFVQKIARGGAACTEHHLSKSSYEIKKIHLEQADWVADLNVDSGKIMAGVGTIVIANSPYRGEEFVTRKITDGIARILAGEQQFIELGNLDSYRDWGHAEDYMYAAWLMLQRDQPKDYVIAMGETHCIKEFLDIAFNHVGIEDWSNHVKINPNFIRPSEVDVLIGDPSKAIRELKWTPKYSFNDLVYSMVRQDCIRKGVADRVKKRTNSVSSHIIE